MIHYLVTQRHSYTLGPFLTYWARDFRRQVMILTYPSLLQRTQLQPGTYLFTDLDRLSPDRRAHASQVFAVMQDAEGFQTLNNPDESMDRYRLLRTLNEQGLNDFNIYRLGEDLSDLRFPVFLRGENDHAGALTGVLRNREELAAATRTMGDPTGKVVVEFCDTSDGQGIFRKYSAYHVCGTVIPIHVMLSRDAFVKSAALEDPSIEREEWDYLEQNPHEDRIKVLFRTARIDYGRIDYSVQDGALRVWEINTNPNLLPLKTRNQRRALKEAFLARFREALLEVDSRCETAAGRPIDLPKPNRSGLWQSARRKTLDWYSFNRFTLNPAIRTINAIPVVRRGYRKSVRALRRKLRRVTSGG